MGRHKICAARGVWDTENQGLDVHLCHNLMYQDRKQRATHVMFNLNLCHIKDVTFFFIFIVFLFYFSPLYLVFWAVGVCPG